MEQDIQHNRNFSLLDAYQFLEDNGLEDESTAIRTSKDQFKSYTSTLRRAKVVALVISKGVIDKFYDEVWPSGKTKKGVTRTRFFETLYQRFIDNEDGTIKDDDGDSDIPIEETQFAYEADLRDYLGSNLHIIENGLELYSSESGVIGVEYLIPKTHRRIDILAVDKNNDFVVIELKVSRGHEKTIGQALYYQSLVKSTFKVDNVRIVIVAREISAELRIGTKYLPNVQLYEYQLSLSLSKIQGEL